MDGMRIRRSPSETAAGATMPSGGQRLGVMKFGSRIDLFVPPTATLKVSVGDRVESGVTVVAALLERSA